MAGINFTANMTEIDNASNASNVTSCFGGSDEVEIEELRRMRQCINKDRPKLIADYARIQLLNEDEFDTESPDYDIARLKWQDNVVEYVKYAREMYEGGRISHQILTAAAGALHGMMKCWNKTGYFNKKNPYHARPFPTEDDMIRPKPKSGEKRNISDFSIATGTLAVLPPGKVPHPRTSSPNPPSDERELDKVAIQPQLTTPIDVTAKDPAVQQWVNNADAAMTTPNNHLTAPHAFSGAATRRRMLDASRRRKETEDIVKERDELRQIVANNEELLKRQIEETAAQTAAKTKAQVTAAANAAFDREMQKRSEEDRQREERTKAAIHDAELNAENAQRAANNARERERKAAQELADAKMRMHQQHYDIQQHEQEAQKAAAKAKENEKELNDLLRSERERVKAVERNAAQLRHQLEEKEKEMQMERDAIEAQKRLLSAEKAMLPSCTPANDYTPPKRKQSPRQQQQHPLHEDLQQRQQQNNAPLIDLTKSKSVQFQPVSPATFNGNARRDNNATYGHYKAHCNNSKSDRNNAGNVMTNNVYEYEDTYIRCKQLHVEQMRSARPKKLFSTGSPTEFSLHMNAFFHATRHATITDEDRMDEMCHWFDGEAAKVVRLHQINQDHEQAYKEVIKELDSLFRETQDTFGTTIRMITRGKALNVDSHADHLELYTQLREAQTIVGRAGGAASDEFNRRDIIREILNARLPHLADRYWREDEKAKREGGKPWAFSELLMELHSWINILRAKNPEGYVNSSTKKASVAAVTAAPKPAPSNSYASRLVHSPPKVQQTITCNACGCMHETATCNVLLEMNVEQRLEALTKRGLCFHCLNPGHRASACTQRPTCGRCSRKHATMLHDRKFESPKRKSNMSAAAIPFRPFAGQPTTQSVTTSTTSGEAAAQQESVL